MTEWRTTTFNQLGRIVTGKTPRSNVQEYFGGDIPFITPSDMDGRRIIKETARYLTQEGANATGRSRIPKNAVMVSCIGSDMGKAAVTGREAVTNQQINSIIVDEAIDPMYVFYDLSRRKEEIRLRAGGSAQPILNKSSFGQLAINLPPLEVQRAIASILGALDDKIEQNRRTAQALERLARAIFRAWFVDFEPVKAKAAGATAFPSMPQSVFDALPTRFVDSAIGPVPEGWGVKPLEQCVHLTMGQSPSSEYYNENGNGLPFHQGVTHYGFRFPTHRIYCTNGSRQAEPDDVLVSVRAPVGRINVADCRLILGRGLAGLRHRGGRQSFLLYQLRHVFAEEDAIGEGTIYKAVTKKFLSQMPILSPQEEFERAFDELAKPLDELIAESERESCKLIEMRDYLLPKLLSGAVRVNEPKRFADEVV